jgi:hypothetical protein
MLIDLNDDHHSLQCSAMAWKLRAQDASRFVALFVAQVVAPGASSKTTHPTKKLSSGSHFEICAKPQPHQPTFNFNRP